MKQRWQNILQVFKQYCRCGQQCRYFQCLCGDAVDLEEEADENANNIDRDCKCRCTCRRCTMCPIYNDINDDFKYLSVLLKENYCTTEWTDGDETDFGDYIRYCCMFRDISGEPRDSNPGHTGELFWDRNITMTKIVKRLTFFEASKCLDNSYWTCNYRALLHKTTIHS